MIDRKVGVCFARDCQAGAKPNQLMCWPHWKRVPRIVQRAIWGSNYLAHPEHELSRNAARASICAKERMPLTEGDVVAMQCYGLGPDGHPTTDLDEAWA